jgi:hypothetical protein
MTIMKKVLLGFLSLVFMGTVAFAQPVSDNAVIPMAITVQSIMRLNIKSGGNIEFVFSKIADITNGIVNSPAYDTHFDVAASQDWDLEIGTDAATFTSDAGTIALDLVELQIDDDVSTRLGDGDVTSTFSAAYAPLVNGPVDILTFDAGGANGTNVGAADTNGFVIHWQCGVANPVVGTPAGRYTVNVYLSLVAN